MSNSQSTSINTHFILVIWNLEFAWSLQGLGFYDEIDADLTMNSNKHQKPRITRIAPMRKNDEIRMTNDEGITKLEFFRVYSCLPAVAGDSRADLLFLSHPCYPQCYKRKSSQLAKIF